MNEKIKCTYTVLMKNEPYVNAMIQNIKDLSRCDKLRFQEKSWRLQ